MLRKLVVACILLTALAVALWTWRPGDLKDILADGPFRSTAGFARYPFPIEHTDRLFDIGVVDANGDGRLDIYTSNHHFRQALLLADGKGGYRDVVGEWRLDQSREFPLAELSFSVPQPDKSGVYVYWRGTNVVVRAHRLRQTGAWRGSMHIYSGAEIVGKEGFSAAKDEARRDAVTETRVTFEPNGDGMLVLRPGSQGLPLDFRFEGNIRPEQIFVGLGKVSPTATQFSLTMQDRHGMAWADFDADGAMDLFVNRGGLGGALRAYPATITDAIRDELLLNREGRFVDMAAHVGIEKQGCSGRHSMWVDYDGDGLLDLFVNCYDRESVAGDYPKQLYRQAPPGVLRNVAQDIGIGLPDQQMGSLLWLDVDGDRDQDVVAFQDEGLVLYLNTGDAFQREIVAARKSDVGERIVAVTRAAAWIYDGKLISVDFDGDGRPDVLASSKRGNTLLRNVGGRFEVADLAATGLPATSTYAAAVDFDNDGRVDLHLVPQGLYRQRPDGRFERTGLLEMHPDRYQAAIVSWPDLDNDGRRDVVLALHENPDYKPWWRRGTPQESRSRWHVAAYRSALDAGNHWLQVELAGPAGNRHGIGAVVTVARGEQTQTRTVGDAEGAFFSQGHHRVYFGLGAGDGTATVNVTWPDGHAQQVEAIRSNQRLTMSRP